MDAMPRLGVAALLTLLLLCPAAQGKNRAAEAEEAVEEPEPLVAAAEQLKRDETLSKELKLVEQAQRGRMLNFSAIQKLVVHSDIVPEAPEATLWGGDGDVATTGACEEEIDSFCIRVVPGEGRLSACLTAQLDREKSGDGDYERPISEGCRKELDAFKSDRAGNINKNVPLAFACRRDISKHCRPAKKGGDPAAIMDCLREKRKKLSARCAERVFEDEVEVARDFRLNPQLHKACAEDAGRLCAEEDPDEEGAVTECLIKSRAQASPFCQEQLERWEVQRADDVRLDRHLYRACSADIRAFCGDVPSGDAGLEECLQDVRDAETFSPRCRRAVEERMERQAADYQLNWGLREHCMEDIAKLCKEQVQQIHMAEGYGADSQVIACLETQRERIVSPRCRSEVERQLSHEAQDLRFDHALARACHSDVKTFCAQVVPGSARVIHCLQDIRAELSEQCSAQLLQHEIMMAEDIDYKYPLRRACVVEVQLLCGDVRHGHARIVRCLQDNLEDPEMSQECREQVVKDQESSSLDYRLNYRLKKACATDVAGVCASVSQQCHGHQCQGRVLDCLRERQEELKGEECRLEVFKTIKMEAFDFRANSQTAVACQPDARQLCPGVELQGWRMHICLQSNMEKLSRQCREREGRLSLAQARDVRLQPALMAACSQLTAVFCRDVEPGKGRMQRCLVENMGKTGFSNECRQQLSARMVAAQADYRLDYGLAASCQADVQALCGSEVEAAAAVGQRGSQVLSCLTTKYKLLTEPCQIELNRFVRLSLWNYNQGAALTAVCDADVQARCPAAIKQHHRGLFRAGMVGKCLAKQVVQGHELSGGCRQLVLVAAPRNVRTMFDSSMSLEAVAAKVAQIAHSAGLSDKLVDPKAKGFHAITVSGWVAAACVVALVVVVLGMLTFALWRWARGARQQHRYAPMTAFKEGDV